MGRLHYIPSPEVVAEADALFHDMHFNARFHIFRAMSMANEMSDDAKADLIRRKVYPMEWSQNFLETFLRLLVKKQQDIEGVKIG